MFSTTFVTSPIVNFPHNYLQLIHNFRISNHTHKNKDSINHFISKWKFCENIVIRHWYRDVALTWENQGPNHELGTHRSSGSALVYLSTYPFGRSTPWDYTLRVFVYGEYIYIKLLYNHKKIFYENKARFGISVLFLNQYLFIKVLRLLINNICINNLQSYLYGYFVDRKVFFILHYLTVSWIDMDNIIYNINRGDFVRFKLYTKLFPFCTLANLKHKVYYDY